MPDHLVLVRHGFSEPNFARGAAKKGDTSYITEEYRDRPNSQMRLHPTGAEVQAPAAGLWIQEHVLASYGLAKFDRYFASTHTRTIETAGGLALPGAIWRDNRILREREWGEIQGLTPEEFKEIYPRNWAWQQRDPLHWTPPGGESIVSVAENRVREFFDTLDRDRAEKGVKSVVAATHGEFIWATKLGLQYMSNEDWAMADGDPEQKIENCQVLHWTRLSPKTGEQATYMRWMRAVTPWKNPDDPGVWHESERPTYTNEQMLARAALVPRLFEYPPEG